jgi:hypothetical protein
MFTITITAHEADGTKVVKIMETTVERIDMGEMVALLNRQRRPRKAEATTLAAIERRRPRRMIERQAK